jgi:lactate permease
MTGLSVLAALLPVIVILVLLIWRKTAADVAGLAGWLVAVLAAWLYFQTPLYVILKASLGGFIASFPITIMVGTSIYQITVMLETGAIARVVALIKTVAPKDKIIQIMIINVGFGTLLAAMGATPVSILPPIMLGLGYSSYVAIALPSLGYDALCTYALLGIPVIVFANFVNLPVEQVGGYFARFMPVITSCIALGMLWIVGGLKMLFKGFLPAVLAGLTAGSIAIGMNKAHMVTLTGVAAGIGVILVMFLYLIITRRPLRDRDALTAADLAAEKKMALGRALSPWIILTFFAVLINTPILPFFDFLFNKLAMPVRIIPGAPEKMRILWQAYFWILISTLMALPFLKPSREQMAACRRKWLKRAPRPMLASAVFFAIAYIINHSGKGLDWSLADPSHNMVYVLATAASRAFDKLYPLIAPFLGLLGGFISGSETSAIAMMTKLHLSTAEKIGAVGVVVAAASGIGGGLASVISPAKLQNAAASIDRIGEEAKVLRTTFVIALIITGVCALMSLLWAF